MDALKKILAVLAVLVVFGISLFLCTAGAVQCEEGEAFNVDSQRCERMAP
jgi:hypothetical protein